MNLGNRFTRTAGYDRVIGGIGSLLDFRAMVEFGRLKTSKDLGAMLELR
jgi:hypothetical protein